MTIKVDIPAKFLPILKERRRFKVARGGRASLKSWSFARALIVRALNSKVRVLCARELQRSIRDSVHRLLTDQILLLGLEEHFDIQRTTVTCKLTGSEFLYLGLRYNASDIKSMEGIDIVWVEEAEKTSNESWNYLVPTIRKPGSEIWVSYNLDQLTDPTHQRFVVNPPPAEHMISIESNWRYAEACGLFSDEMRLEMEYLRKVDHSAYLNVWEGEPRTHSGEQVFDGKWEIETFEPGPEWDGPYYGADWGFGPDPSVLIRCWIYDGSLWIDQESFRHGLELDQIPELYDVVPGARDYLIRADNSRPETIKHIRQKGFQITGADKWPGSVEEGITYIRSFRKVYIHERCRHMIDEAKYYRHKLDRLTGDVLPDVVDAHNHGWDSVRYALSPLIRSGGRAQFEANNIITVGELESASPDWWSED